MVKAMTIGTFHGICLQILSQQAESGGVTVIDEYDGAAVIEDILKSRRIKVSAREVLTGSKAQNPLKNQSGQSDLGEERRFFLRRPDKGAG